MNTGFDLDGVLCTLFKPSKTYRQMNGVERKKYKELKLKHIINAKCIKRTSGTKIYIITARKNDLREETESWLIKNNIIYDTLLMLDEARTRDNIIRFKTRMIQNYNIQRFYEDDPKIARKLKKLCPNTDIVLVPILEEHIIKETI